jgi:hypothetical protein
MGKSTSIYIDDITNAALEARMTKGVDRSAVIRHIVSRYGEICRATQTTFAFTPRQMEFLRDVLRGTSVPEFIPATVEVRAAATPSTADIGVLRKIRKMSFVELTALLDLVERENNAERAE